MFRVGSSCFSLMSLMDVAAFIVAKSRRDIRKPPSSSITMSFVISLVAENIHTHNVGLDNTGPLLIFSTQSMLIEFPSSTVFLKSSERILSCIRSLTLLQQRLRVVTLQQNTGGDVCRIREKISGVMSMWIVDRQERQDWVSSEVDRLYFRTILLLCYTPMD